MGRPVKKVSQERAGIILRMSKERIPQSTIAKVMQVHVSTVQKFAKEVVVPKQGRPKKLSAADQKKLVETLEDMQEKHGSKRMVTADDVTDEWKKRHPTKPISVWTVKRVLKEDGLSFRRPTEKILLTPEQAKERLDWCRQNTGTDPHAFDAVIDCTSLKVPRNRSHFSKLQSQAIKGVWRRKGEAELPCAVVHKRSLATNMGLSNLYLSVVLPASGKVFYVKYEGKWNAKKCTEVYGKLAKLLQQHVGKKREYRVLQDNDPSGFKTNLAEEFARENSMVMPPVPKYSPDLVVCDFYLHKVVKDGVLARLAKLQRKTMSNADHDEIVQDVVKGLDRSEVRRAVGSLKGRIDRVKRAGGWHING